MGAPYFIYFSLIHFDLTRPHCSGAFANLSISPGKIAAQCGHATLACYKKLLRAAQKDPKSPEAQLLNRWERLGQAKIAVQVKSQEEIMTLMATARSLGVTAEVVADAGRTQIEAGSLTVLGVGPAPKSLSKSPSPLIWCMTTAANNNAASETR